jgi:hypothetical protein
MNATCQQPKEHRFLEREKVEKRNLESEERVANLKAAL